MDFYSSGWYNTYNKGEGKLTMRRWFHLFWTTLLWGMGAGLAVGLFLQFIDPDFTIPGLSNAGFFSYNLFVLAMGGATISILCQMGFFAYLILRMVVSGIIRKRIIWDYIQVLIILFVLYEAASLRFMYFSGERSFFSFFDFPLIMLILGIGVALWKVKLTNMYAFIPTLFFMTVGTIVEAIPAIRLDNFSSTLYMIVPLFVCNAWQILVLHKLVDANEPAQIPSTSESAGSVSTGNVTRSSLKNVARPPKRNNR